MNEGRAELQLPGERPEGPGGLWETPSFGFPVPSLIPATQRIFLFTRINLFNQRRNFLIVLGPACSDCRAPRPICCAVGIASLSPGSAPWGKSSSKNKILKGFLGVEPPEAPQDSRFLELLQGFPRCLGWQLGQGLGAQTLVKFSLSPFRTIWG